MSWFMEPHRMVRDEDVLKVAVMPDVEGDEEPEFAEGWDYIQVKK